MKLRNVKRIKAAIAMVMAGLLTVTFMAPAMAVPAACQTTAIGLTANYINEVPVGPFDVTCDIGIYFDEKGTIDGVEINGTVADAKPVQFGIYVDAAHVNVTNSSIEVDDLYPHQFVSVTYRNGAKGKIQDNQLTGAHRLAIGIRGSGTSADIRDNGIVGSGPKTSGWAENGIQIDQGATASIVGNLVADHWWDLDNFVSTGIGIYSDNVMIQRNTVSNNDLGVYLVGNGSNFVHNTVEVTYDTVTIANLFGVFVFGDNNGVRQNEITSATGTGLGLGVMGNNNKLIRNDVTGWAENVWDGGDNTKLPKPFQGN